MTALPDSDAQTSFVLKALLPSNTRRLASGTHFVALARGIQFDGLDGARPDVEPDDGLGFSEKRHWSSKTLLSFHENLPPRYGCARGGQFRNTAVCRNSLLCLVIGRFGQDITRRAKDQPSLGSSVDTPCNRPYHWGLRLVTAAA